MAALADETLNWARSPLVIDCLRYILDDPLAPSDIRSYLPARQDLTVGHVIGLSRLLHKTPGSLWNTSLAGRHVRNQSAALYAWLYHLVDGTAWKLLVPPTTGTDPVKRVLRWISGEAESYRVHRNELMSAASSPIAARRAAAESELRQMYDWLLLPFNVEMLNAKLDAPALPPPPPPPPPPLPDMQARAERRADVAWLLAQGAAQHPRPCPFRLFAGGHVDILRYIADLSAYDNAEWVSTGCLQQSGGHDGAIQRAHGCREHCVAETWLGFGPRHVWSPITSDLGGARSSRSSTAARARPYNGDV